MRSNLLKKCISVLLCINILVGFAGCNLAEDIKTNFANRISMINEVSAQELTRLIVVSINDSSKTSDVYSSINDYQMDGLSYSYFSEYLDILRSNSRQDNNGRVNSFRMMSNSECINIVGSNLASRYSTLIGAELMYENEVSYPVYVFFSVDDNGIPVISNEWVRSLIDTYNYGNHYFSFLNDENSDGVRALVAPSLLDPAYNEEAITARVQALCEFYRLRVMSNISSYEIVHLYPGSMSVRIPETLAIDGTTFEEHIVDFTYHNSGNYFIDDDVTMIPDNNLVYLISGENRLLRMGNMYSSNDLVAAMGEPISANYYSDTSTVIAMYSGVIIKFEDVIMSEGAWTGTVTSIRVYGNSSCTLGYNAFIGMSKTSLLIAYPFIDENNYNLSVSTSMGNYTVEFEFDENDNLDMIRVSR